MIACLFALNSFAKDGSSGCGLGWQVSDKKSLLSSSIRATTNGIFLNQTFGMTFGTSDCEKHSIVKNDKVQLHFTEANLDNLSIEMAQGQGESLMGLAAVMGCKSANYSDFAEMTQSHYETIMNDANARSVLNQVKTQIRANPKLAQNCSAII